MTNRSRFHLSLSNGSFDLEALESRRMLDGAGAADDAGSSQGGLPAEYEMTPEEAYESDVDETSDQSGSDADIYSFTVRPSGERPRDAMGADEVGDDTDIYDFGQDRGEEIDDETVYETGDDAGAEAAAPIVTDASGVPIGPVVEQVVDDAEVTDESVQNAPLEEPVAIALIPQQPGITWLGGDAAMSIEAAVEVEGQAPATWTDLAGLPEPVVVTQV